MRNETDSDNVEGDTPFIKEFIKNSERQVFVALNRHEGTFDNCQFYTFDYSFFSGDQPKIIFGTVY